MSSKNGTTVSDSLTLKSGFCINVGNVNSGKVWAEAITINENGTTIPVLQLTMECGQVLNIRGVTPDVLREAVNISNDPTSRLTMEDGRKLKLMGVNAEQLHAAASMSEKRAMSPEDIIDQFMNSKNSGNADKSKPVNIVFGPIPPHTPTALETPTTVTQSKLDNRCHSHATNSATQDKKSTIKSSISQAKIRNGNISLSPTPNVAVMAQTGSSMLQTLDVQSLQEKSATVAAGLQTFPHNNGLPCTEVEMKALVGMFLEITGIAMNDNKAMTSASMSENSESAPTLDLLAKNFAFASIAQGIDAAAASFFPDESSWEALRCAYAQAEKVVKDDHTSSGDNDIDEPGFSNRELTFEEVELLLKYRKQNDEARNIANLVSQFSDGDWESLQQVSIDESLRDGDNNAKKAAKKRDKKQRRKAKLREETAKKVAEQHQKKFEKAIMSWRSRVVSATLTSDLTKLEGLLNESPLRKLGENFGNGEVQKYSADDVVSHLEFLLPNIVPKNRSNADRACVARMRLAQFVLDEDLHLAFKPLRTGRSAFHTACFYGDLPFVRFVIDTVESNSTALGKEPICGSVLDSLCKESGWSPLHYAAIVCAADVMELLLSKGCDVFNVTDSTHTWRVSNGQGITPLELVELVRSGKFEKEIETHGVALQEIAQTFLVHHQDRREYVKKLESIRIRLRNIDNNGYGSPTEMKSIPEFEKFEIAIVASEVVSKSKKKRKKKKIKETKSPESPQSPREEQLVTRESITAEAELSKYDVNYNVDPLIEALLSMGFDEEQVYEAVDACGGTHRATADDLVTWILSQGNRASNDAVTDMEEPEQEIANVPCLQNCYSDAVTKHSIAKTEEEEFSNKYASKREHARRRNREWNNREKVRQQQEAATRIDKRAAHQTFTAAEKVSHLELNKNIPEMSATSLASERTPMQYTQVQPQGPPGLEQKVDIQRHPGPSLPLHAYSTPEFVGVSIRASLPVIGSATSSIRIAQNDDDRTVSSFGSNRGLSVASREFVPAKFTATPPVVPSHTPPPGFMPTTAQPVPLPLRPHTAVAREQAPSGWKEIGGIRSTSKAFMPSSHVQKFAILTAPNYAGPSSSMFPLKSESLLHEIGHSAQTSFEPVPLLTPVSEDSTIIESPVLTDLISSEPSLPMQVPFGEVESLATFEFFNSLQGSSDDSRSIKCSSIWGGSHGIPLLGVGFSSFITEDNAPDGTEKRLWKDISGLPESNGKETIW